MRILAEFTRNQIEVITLLASSLDAAGLTFSSVGQYERIRVWGDEAEKTLRVEVKAKGGQWTAVDFGKAGGGQSDR